MPQRTAGFTLVELIVVLVLIGILAVYAAPKFAGRGGYSELTVQKDLIQSIRFAQQLAMSRTDRAIALVTTASTIDINDNGNPIADYHKQLPSDVTLDAVNLTFDRYGSALNAPVTINVTGAVQSLAVSVEGTTGYAH